MFSKNNKIEKSLAYKLLLHATDAADAALQEWNLGPMVLPLICCQGYRQAS